ncbi:YchF/TatD family DNA exonuclease [Oceanobacillus sp. 143]|uniref:Hydrolase TatD n=1 Tax=Oceanobacillus zhaokaii TaxID=2052660 RepID=A0A345PC02_9BACI|nr:TatD family hydrolase [Oceanobacillus zhaokaii]AXI07532.1 hydrolase TatD [Oceanobacillus zhaokaii]QGS67760.1 YchF/TatD family DNA exonuclease [Oceanobacillus sp. 143]
MLFDTHTHLNAEEFTEEIPEAVKRAEENGVTHMAVVGFDTKTIDKSLELSESYDGIYSIIGWHPTESYIYTDAIEEKLYQQLKQPKVVAMGEMGLDYHWDTSPKDVQKAVFRRQMRIAKELKLPISIHMRDAIEDTYQILKEEHVEDIGGIMHSFSGDIEWMERFLDLGMHISLSGVVTFKNAKEVKEVAKAAPLDKLLIETDAPYLSPVPYRGKRNEPAYVKYVAEEIAKLREIPTDEIAKITTKNAFRLFGINEDLLK